jgi:antitoxin (DNA-binding transcriptional repressor) of toxin-antitoxin stability system
MQSITLRQLRDTKQVKEWLRAGVHIEVRERGEVIGDLVPRTPAKLDRDKIDWPDFEARLKRNFGDRVIPAVEMLIEDREDRF